MPNKHVVVLTGAGISAESGLKTFRDSGGLWEGFDVHEVASIEGWEKDRQKVLDFYNLRRSQASKAQPNKGHLALSELEDHFKVTIITQNVDDLHEKAGSSNVIHLHGELTKACSEFDTELEIEIGNKPIQLGDKAPDGYQLRPAIVWFGEMVPKIEVAAQIISTADILLVIGTSLSVYPAAGLIHYCKEDCAKYLIDPGTPALYESDGWHIIQKTATLGVPEITKELMNDHKNV